MDIMLKVLEIVTPVFALAGVGFAWVKLGYEYRVQFVTRLAMSLAIPCLIFVSLMQTEIAPAALGALTLAESSTGPVAKTKRRFSVGLPSFRSLMAEPMLTT